MKKIPFTPGVAVPLLVLILFFAGAITSFAGVLFVFVPGKTCGAFASISVGAVLMAPLYWSVRRVLPGSAGTRLVVLLIGFSLFMAYAWISCRMAS